MVGVALILDPMIKKDFLKNSLGWQDEWVDTVLEHFTSSFRFYREKSKVSAASAPVSIGTSEGLFWNFKKKQGWILMIQRLKSMFGISMLQKQ